MPYVKRTASGRISAVYDRPSRDAKERVRANDPEMLRFLGLAPTQSASTVAALSAGGAALRAFAEDLPGDPPAVEYPEEPRYEYQEPTLHPSDPEATVPMPSDTQPSAHGTHGVTSDFSLPDDMPSHQDEDDGAEETFGLKSTAPETSKKPDMDKPEEMFDEPVFESSEIPLGNRATEAPTAKSHAAGRPTPPAKAEPSQAAKTGQTKASAPTGKDGAALEQLDASDLEMARITEDLIDLLIGRNIINFTDFPNMAQRKLINRRALRSNMSALTNLVSDEENIF